MMREECIQLVLGADDAFAEPLAVTLYTALRNLRGTAAARVFILDGGISESNRRRLRKVTDGVRLDTILTFVKVKQETLAGLYTSDRLSQAAYLRLLAPELVPPDVEKILYLDSDILVCGDLYDLWNEDLSDSALLAAQDFGSPYVASQYGLLNYRHLGLAPETPYLNSGVLVINLKVWRAERLGRRVLEYIKLNPDFIRWCDQDGLNAVLSDRWKRLDRHWNVMPQLYIHSTLPDERWSIKAELEQSGEVLRQNAKILHYSCDWSKPWLANCRHPLAWLWVRHLLRSGWIPAWRRADWVAAWFTRRATYRLLHAPSFERAVSSTRSALRYYFPWLRDFLTWLRSKRLRTLSAMRVMSNTAGKR